MKQKEEKIYVYCCNPIDQWEGWTRMDFANKKILGFFLQACCAAASFT